MATNDRGLGSDNMSQADKAKIHSMGGKASHGGGNTGQSSSSTGSGSTITNHSGGGALDKDAQRKGGKNSHRS